MASGGQQSRWAKLRNTQRRLEPPGPPTGRGLVVMAAEGEGGKRLKEAVRRYRSTRQKGVAVDERPGCVYGMLTREQLDNLAEDMKQVRATLNRIYVSVVLMLVGLVLNVLLERLGLV